MISQLWEQYEKMMPDTIPEEAKAIVKTGFLVGVVQGLKAVYKLPCGQHDLAIKMLVAECEETMKGMQHEAPR